MREIREIKNREVEVNFDINPDERITSTSVNSYEDDEIDPDERIISTSTSPCEDYDIDPDKRIES